MNPENERILAKKTLLTELYEKKKPRMSEVQKKLMDSLLGNHKKRRSAGLSWEALETAEILMLDFLDTEELKGLRFQLLCMLEYYDYKDRALIHKELLGISPDDPDQLEKNRETLKQIRKRLGGFQQSAFHRPAMAGYYSTRLAAFIGFFLMVFSAMIFFFQPQIPFFSPLTLIYGLAGILGAGMGTLIQWREIPKSLIQAQKLSALLLSKLVLGFLFGVAAQMAMEVKLVDSVLFSTLTGKFLASLAAGYSENWIMGKIRKLQEG